VSSKPIETVAYDMYSGGACT